MEKHGRCALDRMEQFAVILLTVFVFDAEADAVCDEKERAVRLLDFGKIISVFSAGLFELSQKFSAYAKSADVTQGAKNENGCDDGREENEKNEELTCRN